MNALAQTNSPSGAQFKNELAAMDSQLAAALPPGIKVDFFKRIVLTAVSETPDLLACDRRSLFTACLRCAADGLIPDKREAALVKFESKNGPVVQYMPMCYGLMKKVRNTGLVGQISAHVVYSNEEFAFALGDNEGLVHVPRFSDRGKPVCAYMIAKDRDGQIIHREVMSYEEIEKIRACSRWKDQGPWVNWWEEKARVAVIKRGCKYLPSSVEVSDVIEHDNEEYDVPQLNGTAAHLKQAPVTRTQAQVTQQIEQRFESSIPPPPAQTQAASDLPPVDPNAVPEGKPAPVAEKQPAAQTRTAEVAEAVKSAKKLKTVPDKPVVATPAVQASVLEPVKQAQPPSAHDTQSDEPAWGSGEENELLTTDEPEPTVSAQAQPAIPPPPPYTKKPAPIASKNTVLFVSGFNVRDSGGANTALPVNERPVLAVRFEDAEKRSYFTKSTDVAHMVKTKFIQPKVRATVWYVQDEDGLSWITNIE